MSLFVSESITWEGKGMKTKTMLWLHVHRFSGILTKSIVTQLLSTISTLLYLYDSWVVRYKYEWQITEPILIDNQRTMTLYAAFGGLADILWIFICVTLLDVVHWWWVLSPSSRKRQNVHLRSGGLAAYSSQIQTHKYWSKYKYKYRHK